RKFAVAVPVLVVTVAATLYAPAVALALKFEEVATPLVLVVSVSVFVEFDAKIPLAPDEGAVNVTDTPLTGLPYMSSTVAISGSPNIPLSSVSCSEPLVAAIVAGPAEVFVKLKVAVAMAPARLAVTVSAPTTPLAVNADDMATPLALVVSVSVFDWVDANVPLAPVDGAEKTTKAPLTG